MRSRRRSTGSRVSPRGPLTAAPSRSVSAMPSASPGAAVHGFQNAGTEDAKFLAVASPGVMSPDYFREIHEVLAASGGGPPDPAKLRDVMRRHGLTPAPPA